MGMLKEYGVSFSVILSLEPVLFFSESWLCALGLLENHGVEVIQFAEDSMEQPWHVSKISGLWMKASLSRMFDI